MLDSVGNFRDENVNFLNFFGEKKSINFTGFAHLIQSLDSIINGNLEQERETGGATSFNPE